MDPTPDEVDDEARLAAIATALADAIDAALPGWVERCVLDRAPLLHAEAADAGRRAAAEIGPELRALLATDVDEQRSNPLAILRGAVRYPTEVLAAGGVPPTSRSGFDEDAFPDDAYGLTPATWADVDPGLQERGIVWGAAKAHVVLSRRKREGMR